MSETTRVIRLSSPESTADETVKRVLDLARDLEPPPETMGRLTEKLAAALPAGALGAGALAGGAGAASATASLVGKSVGTSMAVKSVVGVTVVALGGAGVYGVVKATSGTAARAPEEAGRDQEQPKEQNVTLHPSATGSRPIAPLPPADAARPLPSFALPLPTPSIAPRTWPSGSAPVPESESALLARAHEELLHGSAPKALSLAGEHKRLYPRGALAQERDMIEIEALVKMSAMPAARARAETFRKAYPGSTYGERLDALVGP